MEDRAEADAGEEWCAGKRCARRQEEPQEEARAPALQKKRSRLRLRDVGREDRCYDLLAAVLCCADGCKRLRRAGMTAVVCWPSK